MNKKIAIIGYGFVGKSCELLFKGENDIFIIDPTYNENKIKDLENFKPDLVFVCVNPPTMENGDVDCSTVESILGELSRIVISAIVVIKSTIPPKDIDRLYSKFSNRSEGKLFVIYSPEFLREKSWEYDTLNPALVVFGGNVNVCQYLYDIYKSNSNISETIEPCYFVSPMEASLIKYSINSFLATKVVFMNQLYQLCEDLANDGPGRIDWETIKSAFNSDKRTGGTHTNVPGDNNMFGFGGSCFPKDVKAMLSFDKNKRLSVISEASEVNTKLRLMGKYEN